MTNEEKIQEAKEVYAKLVESLEKSNWDFTRHDNELFVKTFIGIDGRHIDFFLRIMSGGRSIQYLAPLPLTIPEEKRIDLAMAVCFVNDSLINGSFDLNLLDGSLSFRLTTIYIDNQLSTEFFRAIIIVASNTIHEYIDKFAKISDGTLSVQQLIEEQKS